MAINRDPDFVSQLLEMIQSARRRSGVESIYLGGTAGPGGGSSQPPGGFIGKLNQSKVTYDTAPDSTIATSSSPSLVDNLNHMRSEARRLAWWGF